MPELKIYHIYYKRFNLATKGYVRFIKVVETTDIFHEVGKLVCQSMEKIEDIHYFTPRIPQTEVVKKWIDNGFVQWSENLWIIPEVE